MLSLVAGLMVVAGGVGAREVERDWWAYRAVERVAVPATWKGNAIDYFVERRLGNAGLEGNGRAGRRELLRRLRYDLTGLPPTPGEVEAFEKVGEENLDVAYAAVVEGLLGSPRYGERWGRHWLDVVRFGESKGYEQNHLITNLWPFRDYVIRAFNTDKPFDEFIREHVAGDVIAPGNREVEAGSMFLVAGPYDSVGNQDAEAAAQIRANTIDEMIRATSEAFLGTTVGCARCHDHKFDPVSQADYYRMYATFAGVKHGNRVVAKPGEMEARSAKVQPLEEERARLVAEKAALVAEIRKRGEAMRGEVAKGWVRERVERTGVTEEFDAVEAKFVRLVVEGQEGNPEARTGFGIDEFEVWTVGEGVRNVALAANGGKANGASRVAPDFDGAYGAELTIDGRFGARWQARGPVLTIELAQTEKVGRVVFSSDRTGNAGGHGIAMFVSEYRVEVSGDGEEWTEVASSRDRKPVNEAHAKKRLFDLAITADDRERFGEIDPRVAKLKREIAAVPTPPNWWVGTRDEVAGRAFHVFGGGSPQRVEEEVVPASLGRVGGGVSYELERGANEAERRLAFADWLVDPANPLTARVMANRVWQHHFGRGLVATSSDFGAMGREPTHPELLDWLACELVRGGWRLKRLHRLIVTSEAYRRSSAWSEAAGKTDAGSELLWRFPPRRLSAEEIRDTMLTVAGQLDLKMGGPGFRLYDYQQDNVATYVPLDVHGPETYRRAVYHHNARAAFVDGLAEFDCPDNAFAAPVRATTTTPLQALSLMNHGFTQDMARYFAERVGNAGGSEAQVRRAWRMAFGREADDGEVPAGVELVEGHGLRALCRAILNTNELIYLD